MIYFKGAKEESFKDPAQSFLDEKNLIGWFPALNKY